MCHSGCFESPASRMCDIIDCHIIDVQVDYQLFVH